MKIRFAGQTFVITRHGSPRERSIAVWLGSECIVALEHEFLAGWSIRRAILRELVLAQRLGLFA